jgi:hypothetical protein
MKRAQPVDATCQETILPPNNGRSRGTELALDRPEAGAFSQH